MSARNGFPWTLDALTSQAALALAVDYAGAPNGRVRDVPDPRTVRYYTTLGLLDRPGDFRGRTALYGRRHLLQLVAIKRLQAQGLTLQQVQERLLGATDRDLETVARLPADIEIPEESPPARPAPAAREPAFWKTTPVAPEPPRLPQGVPLADDVLLLLTPVRPTEPADVEAIRAAAAPLLKLLAQRRLTRAPHERREP
jgi:DNA-binding transcriptional MerR regulator